MQLDVHEFHKKFDITVNTTPTVISIEEAILARALIFEEAIEVDQALESQDLAGIAKECADLIYVTVGLCVRLGIDLTPVWKAVHETNMTKVAAGKKKIAKVKKPDGWKPPDIQAILEKQGLDSDRPQEE